MFLPVKIVVVDFSLNKNFSDVFVTNVTLHDFVYTYTSNITKLYFSITNEFIKVICLIVFTF